MTVKLVSANLGLILIVERDGKQEKLQLSAVCPSSSMKQPHDLMFYLEQFLNDAFETDIQQVHVPIVRPAKIKARRKLTQKQFNKKIGELV